MNLTKKQIEIRSDPAKFVRNICNQFQTKYKIIPPTSTAWRPTGDKANDKLNQELFRNWLREDKGISINGCSCSPDYGVYLYSLCDGHDILYSVGGDKAQKKADDKYFYFSIIDRMKHYPAKWHLIFYWISLTRWVAVSTFGRWLRFGRYYNG